MDERQCKMEDLVIDPDFCKGRRVFLTGHTGFKGARATLVDSLRDRSFLESEWTSGQPGWRIC